MLKSVIVVSLYAWTMLSIAIPIIAWNSDLMWLLFLEPPVVVLTIALWGKGIEDWKWDNSHPRMKRD